MEGQFDFFLGTSDTLKGYVNKYSNECDDTREETKDETKPSNVLILSKETLRKLDEDELKLLKRTRTANDYNEVFMQSSLDFYDDFYNNEDVPEIALKARSIRRVYKIYSDFIKAIELYDEYMDYLIEKYGGEKSLENKIYLGNVEDWIPCRPILSKKCQEYDLYLAGIDPSQMMEESDDELFRESLESFMIDDSKEPIVTCDILSNIGDIKRYESANERDYGKFGFGRPKKNRSVNINDLESLNKVFQSWYKDPNSSNEMHEEYFKNAPENIKKRYYEHSDYYEPGLLAAYARGEIKRDEEEVEDLNEMVYDEVTRRNMPRKEYYQRSNIRTMASLGCWSESRLRHCMLDGSKLKNSRRRSKISKKRSSSPSTEMMNDFFGEGGVDPVYSEKDIFSDMFMSMMRGDD